MREIKFRGKSTKTGKWFHGSYVYDEEWNKHYIYHSSKLPDEPFYYLMREEIDEKTVGQFIGIKDIKGHEIYEGDIIIIYYKNPTKFYQEIQAVVFSKKLIAFTIKNNCKETEFHLLGSSWIESREIIGNIYDNKDLLNGRKFPEL